MSVRLKIYIYSPHICIYSYLYSCAPTELQIYTCSTRPQITMSKSLALQEAAFSMHGILNGVLQKLL